MAPATLILGRTLGELGLDLGRTTDAEGYFAEEARRVWGLAGWFEASGPWRTRRVPPGARHVPGRAPDGGYDLSAPGGTQEQGGQDEDQSDGGRGERGA